MKRQSTVLGLASLALLLLICIAILPDPLQAAQRLAVPQQANQPQSANAGADLAISTLTFNPANPGAGDTADVIVVVKNQGDAATTTGFNLYLYIEPADNPPTQSTPHTGRTGYGLPLPASGVFTYTLAGQSFTVDNPKVYAWVDPPWENKVAEPNDNNNLYPPAQEGPDIYEPSNDDVCANATEITQEMIANGIEQQHNLYRENGADVDWVKFAATSGVTYLAQALANGADADLVIEIHASCDGQPGLGNGAKLEFTAPTNAVYYLKLSHNQDNYGPDNAYRFKLTSDSGCMNVFEPNDTCPLSGELALANMQTHSLCKPGDVDWMRFPVTAGAQYKVTAGNAGARADVRMSLYMSCSDVNSTATGQELQFTATSGGFVYIKTENRDSTVHGAGAEYTLKAERQGADGCTEDSFEPDDRQPDARSVAVNSGVQTHNICPAGDEDWAKFEATAGTNYTVETFNLAQSSDTVLCLHATSGDKIVCDDDGGPGRGSRITWQAPGNGTYFLRIQDSNPAVAGPDTQYELRVVTTLCNSDAFEPDNSLINARPLTPDGSAHTHNFCAAADEDWVVFTAETSTTYILETTDTGPEGDTILELYGQNGNLLGQNDDHAPGVASQLGYTTAGAGTYYVKVRPYNPTHLGTGTEYTLRIRPGVVTPTPTPQVTATPTPTPTATPQPCANPDHCVRTLILVNRARIADLYSDAEATQLMDKLALLAQHSQVQGEVIRLDNNTEVSAAYAAWTADLVNVDKANQVAAAIRNLIMTTWQQRASIEYVVFVGDDRALPFRRIPDNTTSYPERTYRYGDPNHPTGAAQRANQFLSDDYYVDRAPTPLQGREVYLPDLAIGRLIETPAEMMGLIDSFLANPVTADYNVLMSGYDFVQDVAQKNCEDWQTDAGTPRVDCSLIGNGWDGQTLRALQLRANVPFKIQSINGHAAHFVEGAPVGAALQAHEVANSPMDLSGGLIYSLACHAGLNMPPNNSVNPLDLPQAFISKRANYVGNTGYGWGLRDSIGLSEKLMRLYTQELLRGTQASMGKALISAKQLYFQQESVQDFDPYEEKVLQELIFYGLPMTQLQTSGALDSPANEFPGVLFTPNLPPAGSLGTDHVVTGTVRLNTRDALGSTEYFTLIHGRDGDYYALDGSVATHPGQPIQPLHLGDVSVTQLPAHGVLLRSATYTTETDFNALVAAPYNEYITDTIASADTLSDPLAWYPPILSSVQTHEGRSTLLTQIGQYNPSSKLLRLYDTFDLEVTYSTSADQMAPDILVVDGLYHAQSGSVEVKVDAVDASGIQKVIVSSVKENIAGTQIQSVELSFNAAAHKWLGNFNGDQNVKFFVQVMDQAGNVRTDTNKGRYYSPTPSDPTPAPVCDDNSGRCVFLPLVSR